MGTQSLQGTPKGTQWGHRMTPMGHHGDTEPSGDPKGDTMGTPWGHWVMPWGHHGDTMGTQSPKETPQGTPWGHQGVIG